MNKIKRKIKNLIFGRLKKGRNVEIKATDIMLTSYPKSGNTWLRFLIGNLISDFHINFDNIEKVIPDIYRTHNYKLLEFSLPRIMKSHEYYDPRYKKVVYIVRDPRSVAVSYFHYLKKFKRIDDNIEFSEYLPRFINGDYDSYGSWDQNVTSWISVMNDRKQQFLLIKYEDLKTNTFHELKNIMVFLGNEFSDKDIRKAIELSSFKKMKSIEKKKASQNFKDTNLGIAFVRKGSSEEWRQYFTEKDHKLILDNYTKQMNMFGYDLNR